jgi:quercetin dioxygenase-like cupin family protein
VALHHLAPGEKIHLPSVTSNEAKTAAFVKTDAFEAVQLILRSGETIAAHAVAGFATILCMEGSVTLHAATPVKLGTGDWVYLDRGERHSVAAHEDSSLMVTILFE